MVRCLPACTLDNSYVYEPDYEEWTLLLLILSYYYEVLKSLNCLVMGVTLLHFRLCLKECGLFDFCDTVLAQLSNYVLVLFFIETRCFTASKYQISKLLKKIPTKTFKLE